MSGGATDSRIAYKNRLMIELICKNYIIACISNKKTRLSIHYFFNFIFLRYFVLSLKQKLGGNVKKLLMAASIAMSLSACATEGVPANKGAALTPAQSVFVGTWSGKLPSGTPVSIVVKDKGGVSYTYQSQPQSLSNVKLTTSTLSFTVGNGSTVVLTSGGAYTFTWGPTGQKTLATLSKG